MPRQIQYKKDDIVNVTYKIVQEEGFESVNARRIAKELNCSVHPIFKHFENMEDLKKEVYNKIYEKYEEYMKTGINKEESYKQIGLSYIKFAKEYPEFFKILLMQKTSLDAEKFVMTDKNGEDVIKSGQKLTGFSYEQQKKFHIKVWMFTHGIATLVATKTVKFSDEEIEDLLTNTVKEMVIGHKVIKGEKK